jgi:hypothetical protein
MKIEFIDGGRELRCPPDPAYPNGIDIDVSKGTMMTCSTDIPYPAPRCGLMRVVCEKCGILVVLTVAGRLDDPRSVKIPCSGVAASPTPPT